MREYCWVLYVVPKEYIFDRNGNLAAEDEVHEIAITSATRSWTFEQIEAYMNTILGPRTLIDFCWSDHRGNF